MISEVVKIDQFGTLRSGFRNIRCAIDGRRFVFELIPSVLLPPDTAQSENPDPLLRKLTRGASLVVEGSSALRLEFDDIHGMAVHADVDADLFGGIQSNWREAPYVVGSVYYPLLEIMNSPWKAQLPDWRRRDDAAMRHIRMISDECSFDVLGELVSGTWIENVAAD